METAFYNFINQFGYVAVAALIFLENVFPPIPSELVLPLSGAFTTTTDMTVLLVIISATIGATVGAYILYGIGRLLSKERLERFFSTKPMRLLGFKKDDISKSVDWFERRGTISVLFCRCVPVVRSLISIPAGTAKMNLIRFGIYTFMGSLVWNTVLVILGAGAGSAWANVTAQAEDVSNIVTYVIIGIVILASLAWFFIRILPAIKEHAHKQD